MHIFATESSAVLGSMLANAGEPVHRPGVPWMIVAPPYARVHQEVAMVEAVAVAEEVAVTGVREGAAAALAARTAAVAAEDTAVAVAVVAEDMVAAAEAVAAAMKAEGAAAVEAEVVDLTEAGVAVVADAAAAVDAVGLHTARKMMSDLLHFYQHVSSTEIGGGGGGGGGVLNPQEGAAMLDAVLRTARNMRANVNVDINSEGRPMSITRRPNEGTVGRAVNLFANYFRLQTAPGFPRAAYHYDVTIKSVEEARMGGGGRGGGGRGGGRGGRGVAPEPAGPEAAAEGEDLPPRLAHRVLKAAATQYKWPDGAWRFDGRKNLYLPGQGIPPEVREWKVTLPPREGDRGDKTKSFVVTTKHVNVVDLSSLQAYLAQQQQQAPRDAMQVLDVVIRHAFAVDPLCTVLGRGYYYPGDGVEPLTGGAEVWKGFQQSFKLVESGLMLNLDSSFAAFMSERSLPELLAEMCNTRDLSRVDPSRLRSAARNLSGFKVTFPMKGGHLRKKPMIGLSEQGAANTMFHNEAEGRSMSVAEYFKSTGRPLRYPNLPCANVGNRMKPTYIPVELCTVVAGQRRMKLDAKQSAGMISAAKQDPRTKGDAVVVQARRVQSTLQGSGTEAKWGLKLNTDLMRLPGRLLPTPVLQYGSPVCFDVGPNGSWNLRDVKFHEARALDSWAVVCCIPKEEVDFDGEYSLWDFLIDMCDNMGKCGMAVVDPVRRGSDAAPPVVFQMGREIPNRGIENAMRSAAEAAAKRYKKPAKLLLVILPESLTDEYREIKRVSDIELGIPSQVVAGSKAKVGPKAGPRGGGPQYCANVAMKINNKLGGVNVTLSGGLRYLPVLGGQGALPFMIMGADVTHPTGAAARADVRDPSVAAVVASLDQSMGRWGSRVLLQTGRQEVITGMATATKELLLEFYRANRNTKPQRLVMYRDGVSEGQFDQVLAEEYMAIRKACRELEESYRPAITFIVVQKRHNTRLLPADGAASDQKGNVLPGTVVDKGIVAPDGFDFYLNSHAGLQGTNKPAHYHVLIDEIGFGADGVELLTYWLCYLYQRTTKSVSYCPPAYYADRAAFRGRTLLAATSSASDTASEAGSMRAGQGGASAPATFAGIHRDLSNVLYFM
ncbi:Argonaute-like protein [Volvox carteri f. nagariensis]|uniref:Argonaute-like protein n=1 Tax=Volvox carteri f. nagariensis TaxID=3068 RepID=D8U2I8_VOLCA|nr:Argonaute-like protein [Volvox carteri f. nagariensis]EFJ46144.1 Argonaute-like protein [Volvox carteri f. nagariensis]|eukprot:XP_002952894.1 Argonaute-like protein [Volvox carteri f. nagariensis]